VDEKARFSTQFENEKGRVPVPTNILLDRQHRVTKKDTGFSKEKFAELKAAAENLISQK
jgi:hypothetical protein